MKAISHETALSPARSDPAVVMATLVDLATIAARLGELCNAAVSSEP